MIGETFGRYTLLKKLGQGGMGEVFLAHDASLDRKLALKLLPEATKDDLSSRHVLLQEARAAAAIDHPYICKIYEVGEVAGKSYIGMEFVEGSTLQQRLKTPSLPLKAQLQIAEETAEALAKAHDIGIVHGDLKPSNIMLTSDGHVKVTDFGLARRIVVADSDVTLDLPRGCGQGSGVPSGQLVGTLSYMSPEQIRGQLGGPQSDLFSLGIILYEMLTGTHPFRRDTSLATMMAILNEQPPPIVRYLPRCPDLLEHVVRKLLAKELRERYHLAAELLSDVLHLQQESTRAAPLSQSRPMSIAVIPLVNLSAEKENEYFSDGITEDLISQLSRIEDLRVIARTSIMRYKGTDKPVEEIGRELGADTILEGSVRRVGNRVRIRSGLVDVATRRQLWAETYDREMADIFALQDEVAGNIVTTLKASFYSPQKQRPERTKNLEAYHHYLKGLYFLNKSTPQDIQKGIQYFNSALDIDPTYARSYAGISTGYAIAGLFGYLSPREAFPKAKLAAKKALELDESLSEAHASMALVMFFHDWDWAAVERGFVRAIELNPNFTEARMYYSWYLTVVRRFEEAVTEARNAIELDPLSALVSTNLGWVLYMASRFNEAIEQFQKTLDVHPDFLLAKTFLAAAYQAKGMHAECLDIVKKFCWPKAFLGQAYAVAGQTEAARRVLAELLDPSQGEPQAPHEIALIYLHLGDWDAAFRWFEKAFQERDCRLIYLGSLPETVPYRSDPRFVDLLKRIGLPR